MYAHVRSKKLKFFSRQMTIFSREKRSRAYTFSVQKDLIIVASVYFRKFCARAHARAVMETRLYSIRRRTPRYSASLVKLYVL